MGIFLRKNVTDNLLLGIWEIGEPIGELMKGLGLSSSERMVLSQMKSESRKQQWIASRKLINNLLEQPHEVNYTASGKPFLTGSSFKISLSHSGKFVAAIVNKGEETGIDIEQISSKVDRIKHKFLNEAELDCISADFPLEQLHVLWGAKEALYKLYGKKELIFKSNLLIEPFEYTGNGEIKGIITGSGFNNSYRLYYEKVEDYIVVYVLGD